MSGDGHRKRSGLLDFTGTLVHNKYRVVERLASGGMGDVYKAQHELLGKDLAIKFMKPDLASDKETMTRFFKEAQIAASTKSDHVVDVSDLGFHENIPFIVMEYLEGVTVEDAIYSKSPPGPKFAAHVLLQTSRTLYKIHQKGVIHRDLKPSNLMIVSRDDRKIVKILDFGISLLKSGQDYVRLTSTGAILGTPCYMAPEQATGEREIDHRVDVYAMGAILYEMLALRPPFTGDNYNRVIVQVATTEPDHLQSLIPSLDPEICRITHKALAKHPYNRYQNAADMSDDLVRYVKGVKGAASEGILTPDFQSDGGPAFDTPAPGAKSPGTPTPGTPTPGTPAPGTPANGTFQPISFDGSTGTTTTGRRNSVLYILLASIVGLLLVVGGAIAIVSTLKNAKPQPGEQETRSGAAPLSQPEDPTPNEEVQAERHAFTVYSVPAEAEVRVNDKVVGTSPLTIQVVEGPVVVTVGKEGYEPAEEKLVLANDATRTYKLTPIEPEPSETEEEIPKAEKPRKKKEPRSEKKSSKKKSAKKTDSKKDETKKPPKKKPSLTYGAEVD